MRRVSPFRQFRSEMDRVLSDVWAMGSNLATRAFPALNVWETDGEMWAEAELPGVKQEDLDIDVVGNELTIRGQRTAPTDEKMTFHRQERTTGSFRRTVRLPVEVDADNVSATLRDGVLTIRLPKSERAKPRKVQVSVG